MKLLCREIPVCPLQVDNYQDDRILMIPIYFTQFTLMLSLVKCLIDQLKMITLQKL